MVRIEKESAEERFDDMVVGLVEEHGYHCDVTGWTRKTFDVYGPEDELTHGRDLLLRVESFALTSGEIYLYDDRAIPLAEAIGTALERDFGVREAVIVRRDPPE